MPAAYFWYPKKRPQESSSAENECKSIFIFQHFQALIEYNWFGKKKKFHQHNKSAPSFVIFSPFCYKISRLFFS